VLRTPKKREAPDVLDRRELAPLLAATEREGVWQKEFPGRRERDRLMLALFALPAYAAAPDPGAARTQAARLHSALNPHHRT
jgi:hypothetical protein